MQRIVLFLCALGLLTACASPPTARGELDGMVAQITLDEATLGFRSGTIVLTDTSGAPIAADAVTLTAVMRQHGMLLPPQTLTQTADGYAFSQLEINMAGEWQFLVRITQNGNAVTVEVPFVFE